jgi:hypothetical protein
MSGTPFWARVTAFEDYGGHVDKRNYMSRGVVDPRTDIDALQFNRLASDMAAVARVTPMAALTLESGSANVLSASVGPVGETGPYTGGSPPAGFPIVATPGAAGLRTVTFPTSYTDDLGVVATFTPRAVTAAARGVTLALASAYVDSYGVVQVYTYLYSAITGTWTASGAAQVVLQVW